MNHLTTHLTVLLQFVWTLIRVFQKPFIKLFTKSFIQHIEYNNILKIKMFKSIK